MPPLASLAPKARVPHEYFFVYRAEHDDDKQDSGDFDIDTDDQGDRRDNLDDSEPPSECRAHAYALASLDGIPKMRPATCKKDHRDHDTKKK